MNSINNINWIVLLKDMCEFAEDRFDVELVIDKDIVQEVEIMTKDTINSFNLEYPNVAKVASVIAFWIRKLKPIYHMETSKNKFLAINELIGLLVGLSICRNYFDDLSKDNFRISSRVLSDWVNSFRKNSHSPHSSVISFELLTTKV